MCEFFPCLCSACKFTSNVPVPPQVCCGASGISRVMGDRLSMSGVSRVTRPSMPLSADPVPCLLAWVDEASAVQTQGCVTHSLWFSVSAFLSVLCSF